MYVVFFMTIVKLRWIQIFISITAAAYSCHLVLVCQDFYLFHLFVVWRKLLLETDKLINNWYEEGNYTISLFILECVEIVIRLTSSLILGWWNVTWFSSEGY